MAKYTPEQEKAVTRWKNKEPFNISCFIDEDTIIAGYGDLDIDFEYPLPASIIREIYGTTSWAEYHKKRTALEALAPSMYEAIKSLNLAIDNYWNSQTKGDDLVKKITKEQAKCWEILKKVG